MLYAAAAVLEGCSFVNGGSQNTMCGALFKLAEVTIDDVFDRCVRDGGWVGGGGPAEQDTW